MLDKPKGFDDRPERQAHSVTINVCSDLNCKAVHLVMMHDADGKAICEATLGPETVDMIKECSDKVRAGVHRLKDGK